MRITIIGGGAAGFFSAIHAKLAAPKAEVFLLEKSEDVLTKVKISGGGRCNVTHACFDARRLADHYPRGGKALIGPFQVFQPTDTMEWFESRGVPLKIEADNRVFPISDRSQSIIDCLMNEAESLGVRLWTGCGVNAIHRSADGTFDCQLSNGQSHPSDRVILATGSSRHGHTLAESLGNRIVPPVPSLFTIKIEDPALVALAGVSVADVTLKLGGPKARTQNGPLLITHWGLSGPAMIKLSAWAAREFYDSGYSLPLNIVWLPRRSHGEIEEILSDWQHNSQKQVPSQSPFSELSGRLWEYLANKCLSITNKRWPELSKKEIIRLTERLKNDAFQSNGKGSFKEEFVTCGGVALNDINFKTMESRHCPGLYLVGEIIDVDGITGGFNFQNAWTTGYIAGSNAGK